MQYLTTEERLRLWDVAEKLNHEHALILKLGFWHGLRVSEIVPARPERKRKNGKHIKPNSKSGLCGWQIQDGQISVQRIKSSNKTLQPLHPSLMELVDRAKKNPEGFLFEISRQRVDQFTKRYAQIAGLHRDKAHFHCACKHSVAMEIWEQTHSLGQIQSYLGHKSVSSTLQYLREVDHSKAIAAVALIR
jgi:integrase/recombinase XerD